MSEPSSSGWALRLQSAWLSRGALAWSLRPLSWLFGAVTSLRRALYRVGALQTHSVRAPVVVVGNLIAGGAGKTPVVMALVDALRRHGYTPGIVSRGYGREGDGLVDVQRGMAASECGDEPLLMHLRTHAPLVVGRDRVAAARSLLQRHPSVDVVVSDDGLQHLRLARDAQVLVFDERGVGNGWLLPAGPLREALPRVTPQRSVVVYNASAASTPLPGLLAQRRLGGVLELDAWWRGEPASLATLAALRGRPIIAAAGLARPERFFAMLRDQGLQIRTLALPDHHGYVSLPWPADTPEVIVTEKDAIKLDPARIGSTRVWVAPLDFALDAAFDAAVLPLLSPPGPSPHGNAPA